MGKKLSGIFTSHSSRPTGAIRLPLQLNCRQDKEVDCFNSIDKLGEGTAANLSERVEECTNQIWGGKVEIHFRLSATQKVIRN